MEKKKEDKHLGNDSMPQEGKNQLETLKEYVLLQENEVAALKKDLAMAKEQLSITEKKAQEFEFEYKTTHEKFGDFEKKIERLTTENEELRKQHAAEIASREQLVQTKQDKLLVAERKADMAQKKYDELKERITRDLKHIRIREKELEAKLEILKRDSETLLQAKDRKLLEFRRKIDSLEYEMETQREKYSEVERKMTFWKERMQRVLRALKLGTSLLEVDEEIQDLDPEITPKPEEEQTQTSLKPVKKVA